MVDSLVVGFSNCANIFDEKECINRGEESQQTCKKKRAHRWSRDVAPVLFAQNTATHQRPWFRHTIASKPECFHRGEIGRGSIYGAKSTPSRHETNNICSCTHGLAHSPNAKPCFLSAMACDTSGHPNTLTMPVSSNTPTSYEFIQSCTPV